MDDKITPESTFRQIMDSPLEVIKTPRNKPDVIDTREDHNPDDIIFIKTEEEVLRNMLNMSTVKFCNWAVDEMAKLRIEAKWKP